MLSHPLTGCLSRASQPEAQHFRFTHRQGHSSTGGVCRSRPCLTQEDPETHTAGTWQVQDLNPGPLPTKAFISQARKIFGSAHKRETRKS